MYKISVYGCAIFKKRDAMFKKQNANELKGHLNVQLQKFAPCRTLRMSCSFTTFGGCQYVHARDKFLNTIFAELMLFF